MAQGPPADLPESIVIDGFSGIRNTVAPEKLTPRDLAAAVNVDLDDVGQARRRRGQALKIAGNFHSLWRAKSRTLVVKDGMLGQLDGYEFRSYGFGAGHERVAYTEVNDTVYFTSRATNGKVGPDGVVLPWGAGDAGGTWVSPVVNPTTTLGQTRGKLLGPPPLATEVEAYSGRIYLAAGRLLWATELFLLDYVDKTRTFIQMEHDITALAAMDDGLYVGTEGGIFFLKGTMQQGLKQTQLTTAPVLRGSVARVPYSRAHPSGQQGPTRESTAAMLMATDGIYAAFDGGELLNMTHGRVEFPHAEGAAALFRFDSGTNQYIASIDSGGTPSANARFGDHVDAEIVRKGGQA